MKKMNDQVKALFEAQRMWSIATTDGKTPNVVPVFFTQVLEDGRMLVADVFLKTTLANLEKGSAVAVSAYDGTTMEGYQVKGTAVHVTEGDLMEKAKAAASALKLTAKGAFVITPEEIIVTTPCPDNGKVL